VTGRSPSRARRPLDSTEVAGIGLIVGLLVAAGVIVLVFSSVPLRFSLVLLAEGSSTPGTQNLTFPANYVIEGTWHTSSGLPVTFQVSTVGGKVVYTGMGSHGSFLFDSTSRPCEFTAVPEDNGPVTTWVNGTYTAPPP
jgi:hypothetical protein